MASKGSHPTASRNAAPACVPDFDGSCSVCADEALPGVVLSLNTAEGTAEVRIAGEIATVALDLVDEVATGDCLMVHLGFAISRVAGQHA